MLTLIILNAFKGSKIDYLKAVLTMLCLDIIIFAAA